MSQFRDTVLRFSSPILPIIYYFHGLNFISFSHFSFCFIFNNICHLQLKLWNFKKFIFFEAQNSYIFYNKYLTCHRLRQLCVHVLYSQAFFFFFFLIFNVYPPLPPPIKFKFRIYNTVLLLYPTNFFLSRCPQKHYNFNTSIRFNSATLHVIKACVIIIYNASSAI